MKPHHILTAALALFAVGLASPLAAIGAACLLAVGIVVNGHAMEWE